MTKQKTAGQTRDKMAEFIANSPLPTEPVLKTMELAKKPVEMVTKPVYTIRNNQIVAGIMGTAGLVMFAFGIENFIVQIPELSSPLVEIVIGIILLSISGLFLKKLT